jgi:MFS family permease
VTPRRALLGAFVANGLGGPSFLARLPERQDALGLSDAGLGAVLLGLALGALVASPAAGSAVRRFGSRRVTVVAGLAVGASLWCTGAAGSAPALFAGLVSVGAADAVMDTAMNANGAAYERSTRRSVLHGLHAAWSIGALGAAGLAALAVATGLSPALHLAVVGAGIAVLSAGVRRHLYDDDVAVASADPTSAGRPVQRRRRLAVLLGLAAATVGGAVIEGILGDWSAVQLDRLGASDAVAPLGFAAFMAGMVGGRLVGDRLTDRFGAGAVLRRGLVLCAAGLAVGIVWAEPLPFAVGVAVAGFGVSGFFPLAFSAAGRLPGIAPGAGAATVSLAARVGFLVEPPIVGTVAEATELRASFALAAAVAVVLAVAATRQIR